MRLVPLLATRCLYQGGHLKTKDSLLQTEGIFLKTKDILLTTEEIENEVRSTGPSLVPLLAAR